MPVFAHFITPLSSKLGVSVSFTIIAQWVQHENLRYITRDECLRLTRLIVSMVRYSIYDLIMWAHVTCFQSIGHILSMV